MTPKDNLKFPISMLFLRSILFSVLTLIAALFISGTLPQRLESIAPYWPYICVCVNLICLPVISRLCRRDGITYSQLINYDKLKRGWIDRFLIPAFSVVIGIAGMYAMAFLVYGAEFLKPADPSLHGIQGYLPHWALAVMHKLPVGASIPLILALPLSVCLVEMPIYMSYVMPRLNNRFNNGLVTVILSAAFYSLQHAFIPIIPDARVFLWRAICFLPLTLFITIYYYRNKMNISIVPLMTAHFVLDLFTALQILAVSMN